jgi:flagellar secretion chaperone FliS
MHHQHAAQTYREAAFENAPPIKILRMLYQGALRFLDQAEAEDPAAPASRFGEYLLRADAIVSELRLALLREHAPAITDDLEQLYLFCEERISTALRSRDPAPIRAAREVLANLLEAWKQVEVGAAA